jgi:hypothetical protein
MTLKARSDPPSTLTFYSRNRSGASAAPRLRRASGYCQELALDAGRILSVAKLRASQSGLEVSEDSVAEALPIASIVVSPLVDAHFQPAAMLLAALDDEDESDDEYENGDEEYDEDDEDYDDEEEDDLEDESEDEVYDDDEDADDDEDEE